MPTQKHTRQAVAVTVVVALLTTLAPAVGAIDGNIARTSSEPAETTSPASPDVRATLASGFSASIGTDGRLTTDGNHTLEVTVTATESSGGILNPVVEVPLPETVSVPAGATDDATAELDNGSTDPITAEVRESTFTGGNAVFLFGEAVPAGDSRTYTIEINASSPGEKQFEADVRPLYNTSNSARTNTTLTVRGTGALSVRVQRPNGTAVSGASVRVDGDAIEGSTTGINFIAGRHTVNASASGAPFTLPNLSVSLGANESQTVVYTVPSATPTQPLVSASTRQSVVIGATLSDVTIDSTAEQRRTKIFDFVVNTSAGTTVVAVPVPDWYDGDDTRSITVASGSNQVEENDDTVLVNISAESDTAITIEFRGQRLGDVDSNGEVTADDAATVAAAAAAGTTDQKMADVNGDGSITAVDAMLIAQYDNGERTDVYELQEA